MEEAPLHGHHLGAAREGSLSRLDPPHEHIHRAQREGSHRLQDSLMECQGTQEEPEGRPGEPGDDKTAMGTHLLWIVMQVERIGFASKPRVRSDGGDHPLGSAANLGMWASVASVTRMMLWRISLGPTLALLRLLHGGSHLFLQHRAWCCPQFARIRCILIVVGSSGIYVGNIMLSAVCATKRLPWRWAR